MACREGCLLGLLSGRNGADSTTNVSGNSQTALSSSCCSATTAAAAAAGVAANDQDAAIARQLHDLSFEEREKIYEDIHGVADFQEETPEFVNGCIQKMQKDIANLGRGRRKALDRAFFLKPSLRYDTKFLLMFLRSDRYDTYDATNRMAKYFTSKVELFGEEQIVKKITLQDLDEDDMDCMNRASFQLPGTRDRSGRYLCFPIPALVKYKHWKNQMRYIWYQIMATLENEDAQIKGIVDVICCAGAFAHGVGNTFSHFMMQGNSMLNSLPFRLSAVHFCYDNISLIPALAVVQLVCDQNARLRFRGHFGSNVETRYELMTFGIQSNAFPILPDGTINHDINQKYIQKRRDIEKRRKQEQQQSRPQKQHLDEEQDNENLNQSTTHKKSLIEYPNPTDVLLGRGRPYQESSGNLLLQRLVDEHRAQYQTSEDRLEKTCIACNLVKRIQQNYGGRFLQRRNDGWEEVDDTCARDKVSHSLRTKAIPKKATTADREGGGVPNKTLLAKTLMLQERPQEATVAARKKPRHA